MTRRRCALLLVAACCGNNKQQPDAAPDTPPAMVMFQGQYVDWDWTTTQACGIFGAIWQPEGSSMKISTPPNGRVMLEVPGTGITKIDITPPTMPSQCTNPMSTYNVPGIALADPAVIAAVSLWSAKAFTVAREMPFFQQFSITFDRTKAHVFVHVDKTPANVTLSVAHGTAIANDGTNWAAGTSGFDVFFPNVDPAPGTANVDMDGGAIGTGAVPLVAGKITYLTLVGH